MEILPFINRLVTSPQRSRNKALVIKEIVSRVQDNQGVVNIHRIDHKNAGDLYCAPHHYFGILKDRNLDIFDYKTSDSEIATNWIEEISNNSLIIGGGGLFNRGSFEKQMALFESLTHKNKKTVIWGAGHNSKNPKDFQKDIKYNVDIRKFGVVGTRDYKASENWVPCVSCLHPVFDKDHVEKREIGVVFHKKTLKNKKIVKKFRNLHCFSNTRDLESLIEFIGSSEKIITDSYHGMYWAILMGKKVVVIPNSSKFFDFKYQPVISSFEKSVEDVNKAVSYTGVLEECRGLNHDFAKKVFEYLYN